MSEPFFGQQSRHQSASTLDRSNLVTRTLKSAKRPLPGSLGLRRRILQFLLIAIGCGYGVVVATTNVSAIEPIARRIPPVGLEIPSEILERVISRLSELEAALTKIASHESSADAAVLLKAVRLAVTQNELYSPKHFALLDEQLSLAAQRISMLQQGKADWQHDPLTVRGFYSKIDHSPQPYGLVIPEGLFERVPDGLKVPLYVWLHGRGDKTTDLHFIRERLSKVGQISPSDAIVLHPFGRHCVGFKSAGETDVMEAIDHVVANYDVNPHRIVLMGFSMGGAGTWHLGAHYTERFVGISPGAGFAETSKYNRLTAEAIAATPWYERQLWDVYDVPKYVQNFFDVPTVAYSGENDKQIQAARVMEAAFATHSHKLDHIIGPGMGHKYHPDSLAEIMRRMSVAVEQAPTTAVQEIHLQTRTLRYAKKHWLQIDQLHEHWQETQIHAVRKQHADSSHIVHVTTALPGTQNSNVVQFTIDPMPGDLNGFVVDGQSLSQIKSWAGLSFTFRREDTVVLDEAPWKLIKPKRLRDEPIHAKSAGLQGPIDDAFLDRFLVVTPSTKSRNPALQEWVEFEVQHLRERWSALFRGTLPEKSADDVSDDDIQNANLVLFGDQESNPLLGRVAGQIPMLKWDATGVTIGEKQFAGSSVVPLLIYPNPLNPKKYVVLNSGPTFREAHDKTNSQQNPKLPDWAVLDISTAPDARSAGRVVDADFFDEYWQAKSQH